jgi:hypothetical protein
MTYVALPTGQRTAKLTLACGCPHPAGLFLPSGLTMIDDPDIFRAAKLLVDRYGNEATKRAVRRNDELQEAGDVEGAMLWRRILAAIEEL